MPSISDLAIVLIYITQLFCMIMSVASFKKAWEEAKMRISSGEQIGRFDLPQEHVFLLVSAGFLALCISLQLLVTPPAIPIDNSYLLDGLA